MIIESRDDEIESDFWASGLNSQVVTFAEKGMEEG